MTIDSDVTSEEERLSPGRDGLADVRIAMHQEEAQSSIQALIRIANVAMGSY
jgi:hypothetical protein